MPLLTDAKIKAFKAADKPYKKCDTGGLYLIINPNGKKWWRFKYSFCGKSKTISFGVYPEVGLKAARTLKDEAKAKLSVGLDPSAERKISNSAEYAASINSLENVAREWFEVHIEKLESGYSKKVISLFEREIFPVMGNIDIAQVMAGHILQAARHICERQAIGTAHKPIQLCGQLFKYAVATGRDVSIQIEGLHGALPKAKVKHMATILDDKAIGKFLRDVENYKGSLLSG